MRTVVVTGGIGSGKSLVCGILSDNFGIPVYQADARVKALYLERPDLLDSIEEAIGLSLKNESGVFQPKVLAEVIFSDSSSLQTVEKQVFPYLMNDFQEWAGLQEADVVAFESATVLEKSMFDGFGDIVLLVDAPVSVRLQRACSRDGVDIDKIRERMSAQPLMNRISEGETCERVDYVIENTSAIEELTGKVRNFIEKYGLTKML